MRVAVVSTPFVDVPPKRYGGTELVVHALCEGLSALETEVVLFATGSSSVSGELRSFFEEARWPPKTIDELVHLHYAFSSIEADPRGFDVVHVHSALALPMFSRLGVPIVYTLHHDQQDDLSRLYLRFPDVNYVAISHRQRQREAPVSKICVIHHGLDADQYPLGHGGPDLLFLGRLSRYKGCHTAIDAAAAVGATIAVAGASHAGVEGEEEQRYFAKELSWRLTLPHVKYLGEVGPPEKMPLIGRSAAMLCPITWEEPFGLVVIEAMLSGTPVIGYPHGALPEIIEHGRTGFLVNDVYELEAKLREVRKLDRRKIRQRARSRFGHLRMASQHLRLYQSLRLQPRREDVAAYANF